MRALQIFLIIIILAASIPAIPSGFGYSIRLKAQPDAIVADARSDTVITAQVRDSSGNAVPDGTTVEFTTSLGIIERRAETQGGVARVRLSSDSTVGTANVVAVVITRNVVAQLKVDFLEPGTEMFDESFIVITSRKYLGYDIDSRMIDAAGGVKISSRGLNISAEEAQINVSRTILRAKAKTGDNPIRLSRGDKEIRASALYYDFTSMSGFILTPPDEGVRKLSFRGRDLRTEPADPKKTISFDFDPIETAQMFIKASSIIIRPGEEVKFKRAVFYVEGTKMMSLPLHVESLKGGDVGIKKMLTYSSDGVRVNLPFYYSVTPNGTGALMLRHSPGGGWGYYSGGSAWQVDLEQEYNFGGSTEGNFSLDQITSSNWGAQWSQRMESDNGSTLYTYLDSPNHNGIYGNVDYSRRFDKYTVALTTRGGTTNDQYATTASIQTRSKSILNGAAHYTLSSRLTYDYKKYDTLNKKAGTETHKGAGLGLQVYGKPLRWGSSSNLTTYMSLSRYFAGVSPGTSISGNAHFSRMIGDKGSFGLNYSFLGGNRNRTESTHTISADLTFNPNDKWESTFYGTYGITDGSMSVFGDVSYMVTPTWRLNLLGTLQNFDNDRYIDAEFAIGKMIGKQEARVIWSQSRKKFRFEFSAFSF